MGATEWAGSAGRGRKGRGLKGEKSTFGGAHVCVRAEDSVRAGSRP